MRTFRLIGMAILAVCVTFASCSSDDDEELTKNDNGIITNQKRLKQIKINTTLLDFTYDSKGRLTCATRTWKDGDQDITNYVWGSNIIMAEDDYNTDTYILDKNLVRSVTFGSDYNYTFTYNSSNQLIADQVIGEYETYKRTYTWDNGKISKITTTSGDYSNESVGEFIYSGKTCKGYFPLYVSYVLYEDDNYIFCAHPELIGMHCSQLPDKVYYKNSESTYEYSYTFDKDGYVESCTEVYTDKSPSSNTTETYTTIYTFTWE